MMLEIWDWLNIVGIVLEISGFIIMLTRIQSKFIGWFESHWNEIIDVSKKLTKEDLDMAKQSEIRKNILDEMPKSFELRGIYLVVIGLGIQIISIIVEFNLS